MKLFFAIFIILLNFQFLSKADDIRDFEIEGISIGDSLLDHFSKKVIENTKFEFSSQSKKYLYSEISDNFENFENLQFIYKNNDKNYKIVGIVGLIFYDNNLNSCLKKKKLMTESVKSIMPSDTDIFSDDDGYPHSQKFPKSLIYTTEFVFKNGDVARVYCLNWSRNAENNRGWTDHLSLNIQSKEFYYWLNNEAYN